ncbi:hypothetical protein HZS61_011336 [Fusarium oxysporum f. sp. conglutinans]|uniref:Uncharacterized protein n=1 Tax=Fusarium oxysporum f. sp. conglutinans TaxID=100902 RepID=A0A8H6LNX9_FUSOX|nr:hypothetical protein HZS61_011336 [Fusarium oxysporum f. sp. conglutinans]
MSSFSPVAHASPHLRKPLDTQRGTGGDMSMMFFAQPDCPSRFAHQDQHRIKGLNAETLARIFLPPPSWLLAAEYAPLRSDVDDSSTSIFFSLNLSIYNQPIVASEWIEEWFFMNGRVHPYALAWEVEQHDGLESDADCTLLYTMPALIVRDQGYQPLFASMDSFPCVPPIVSFAGPVTGPGHALLRQDLLPGLDATQLKCCGFIQLSTYLGPGNPDKPPFRGFHPFQVFVIFPIHTNPWAILCKKMTERRDSQFQPNTQFTCTGKVAGLLDHRVMVQPPGFQRDYVFIVVPDSWTFLDKTTTPTTQPVLPLSAPPKRQASSATSAFQDIRAACYSLATPSSLPPSPPTSSSGQPNTPPLKRHYPDHAQTPTKRQRVLQPAPALSSTPDSCSTVTQPFPASASTSSSSEPNTTRQGSASVNLSTPALDSIVASPSDSPNRPHRSRQPTKRILEKEYNNMNNNQLQYSQVENKPRPN